LTRKNGEGDDEPIPIVNLVILDHNKSRSRAYYEGAFEEGKNSSPRCYSGDGVAPDASVKEPCAATCATCPNAVKGSKITENGKQSTLCSPFKRVAVVPSSNIGQHPAMLLRLAQTSVWDKDNGENESKGWYAWDQYLDMLRARGAKHTAVVETRVKFDMRMAYPKLLFSASRWLNPEEATHVKALLAEKEKEIGDILNGSNAAHDGVSGQPAAAAAQATKGVVDPVASAAAAVAAQAAVAKAAAPKPPPKPTPAPTPAPVKVVRKMTAKAGEFTYEQMLAEGWDDESLLADGMMELVADKSAAPKPPAKPKGPPKPPAKPAAQVEDAGGADPFAAAAKPATTAPAATNTAPAAATTVVTDTPAGLSDLLSGWDDDAPTDA
jgi:hypothetical protein